MHILPLNSRKIYKEHFGARGFEVVAHVNTVISSRKKKQKKTKTTEMETLRAYSKEMRVYITAFPFE